MVTLLSLRFDVLLKITDEEVTGEQPEYMHNHAGLSNPENSGRGKNSGPSRD
jgi:hypothetical protein